MTSCAGKAAGSGGGGRSLAPWATYSSPRVHQPPHTCSRSRVCFRSSWEGSARLIGSTKGLAPNMAACELLCKMKHSCQRMVKAVGAA